MRKNLLAHRHITESPLSVIVLLLLLLFTYGMFIRAPYIGLYFNPTNGEIPRIFIPSESSLRLEDMLLKVGNVSFQEYYQNSRQGLFNDVKDGEIVDITVNRNGEEITVQWKIPGFNLPEFYSRFFNVWWMAYIFWFFGLTVQTFIRPKDTRWRLLVLSNYLTALWIIFGALSARHLWESSILLRAVTWGLLPIYLHFHWLFPKPLAPAPKLVPIILYAASLPLILGELFQILPKTLYALGFLFMLTGIVVLQIIHFIKRPEQRREVGLVALAILLAILPSAVLSISGATGIIPPIATLGLLTLPFMPLTYLFIIYRSQLGGLEMRANRFVSLYAFLIILSTILIILITPAMSLQISGKMSVLLALGTAILTAFISILIFPVFQAFVEKRLLGIKLPSQNLTETYSARITTSATQPSLLKLLEEDVFPSLLVRQYAFVRIANPSAQIMLSKGVTPHQVPQEAMMELIASSQAGGLTLSSNEGQPLGWVRLILRLQLGSSLIGAWLLGRRDPDDFYPQAELPILQSLANQTAIALSNILQTERLQKLYEGDIERNEKSRLQLALDLHDSVLNQLAVLRLSVDDTHVSPNFQGAYDEVIRRLREIVTDLRPPMLSYGLKPAIEGLADDLMERSKDTVNVATDLQTEGEVRYAENIEQHLYRIVQEACENALRHARAANIRVSGTLNPQKIILKIEDDGAGFDIGGQLELDTLLANNHFGLAGIVERVHLIGGEVNIRSALRTGTTIQITWNDNP